MKIFELSYSNMKHFVVSDTEEEARSQGVDPDRFPDLHFRPFEVTEVSVEGYDIAVTSNASETTTKRRGKATASA